MVRTKSLIKGIGSFTIPAFRNSHGSQSIQRPEESYALFMRYLLTLGRKAQFSFHDKTVLEFGPGSSFALGIAALLSGAARYYAFDLIDHTLDLRNLAVFDAIVELFNKRAPIPVQGWSERIFPFLDEGRFPSDLLPDSLLEQTLSPARLQRLRDDLQNRGNVYFRPRFARDIAVAELDRPVDLIFSESVLEHVDELAATYQAFTRWLAPTGIMAHLLDYSAHGLTPRWNGHWQLSRPMWSLVRGKRHYLLNRAPHSAHLALIEANGFQVIHSDLLRRVDGLSRDQFAAEFRGLSLLDSTTHVASLICRFAC
jgi:SAM-dependent methyltransferase